MKLIKLVQMKTKYPMWQYIVSRNRTKTILYRYQSSLIYFLELSHLVLCDRRLSQPETVAAMLNMMQ